MKTLFLYSVVGVFSGFINGLFGTGGAIPILILFTYLAYDTKKAFATANFTVVLLSLVTFFFYLKRGVITGDITVDFFKKAFIPALVGGGIGGVFLSEISPAFLKKLFCVITIIGGVGVIFK
ncbi:MAG: hypothetical protein E7582_06460 [Ruminococcaceae bacterium]|nr:hypothetical protein [Oscillospiraceae bacterium]